jgi:hypothetical protein
MYQYDDPTAASSMPTPAVPGTAGFFTDGSPTGGVPATILRSDFMNMLMMELLNVVEAAGITPSKTVNTQLLAAINSLVESGIGTSAPGRLLNIQVFDTVGTFTYTKTPGAETALVDNQGSGGQGGGSPACSGSQNGFGSGGHSGARGVALISLSGVSTVPVTVGAGGSTGGAGAAGQAGATTSFGSYVSCPGGAGGTVLGPTSSPLIGGNASALPTPTFAGVLQTIISQSGNSGPPAQCITPGVAISGAGGISPAYGGGVTGNVGTGAGNPGSQVGAGGCGAFTAASGSAQVGGAGIRGKIIVYEYA